MNYRYFNSIMSTHFKRLGSLRPYLRSLLIASELVDKNSFEIVIANLDEDERVCELIKSYQNLLNIKHCHITNYKGLFWKTKALNHAASKTEGKYITMIDIDAIVPPVFLQNIQEFYSDPANERVKLAHRVRFLDPKASNEISKLDFNRQYLESLLSHPERFRQAFERYTEHEYKLRGMKDHERKWLVGNALGNSHYTMRREDFMSLGGYDESFIGWSCEHLDFNRRAFLYLRNGTLREDNMLTVLSSYHNRMEWMNGKNTKKNEKIYEQNKKNNVIQIPIGDKWGQF